VAESVLNQQEQNVETKNSEIKSKRNFHIVKRVAGIVLSLIMIGLAVFVYKLFSENTEVLNQSNELALTSGVGQASNYRSYVALYKDTKQQLIETTKKLEDVTQQLNQVTAELNTTKSLLIQTQTMLAQAQSENNKLKEELQSIDGLQSEDAIQNISELEARIKTLKDRNNQATNELDDLKNQLKMFQADFSTKEEGRSLISLFQNKIKLVKGRMKALEKETYFAKIAALKERDRVALLNGNNGYIIQNGELKKPFPVNKSYSIDVKMVQ
jgi:chromosome segregation ATPase